MLTFVHLLSAFRVESFEKKCTFKFNYYFQLYITKLKSNKKKLKVFYQTIKLLRLLIR